MRKRTGKSPLNIVSDVYKSMDRKALVILLALELGTLLMMIIYGRGAAFLPAAIALMLFTAIICIVTFSIKADKYIIIFSTALVNTGLMAQVMESSLSISVKKYLICTVVLCAALIVFRRFAFLFESPHAVRIMMAVQYAVCLATLAFGKLLGDQVQGGRITIRDMTLLEIVKILYVFVAAAMLCNEKEDKILFTGTGLYASTVYLFLHTAVLAVFFALCSEMGTLLVIVLTYLIISWISMSIDPELKMNLPGFVKKLILRFGHALHPERDISGAGYQGTLGLCALALGGLAGIISERYRVSAGWFTLYGADNDFLFANLVETGGFLLGMLIILMFLGLLIAGTHVAQNCSDRYLQGVAMASTVLIFTEALIHIGYNLAILPITGIPLYFCSSGFTALATGMGLTGVLLAISTGKIRRRKK